LVNIILNRFVLISITDHGKNNDVQTLAGDPGNRRALAIPALSVINNVVFVFAALWIAEAYSGSTLRSTTR